jgi:uracil-DNA glycosylase
MSLLEAARNINTDWRDLLIKILELNPQIQVAYDKECATFQDTIPIYPEVHNIFRCFNYFNIADTKVVLLGQDPYHGPGQAIGLCFGVNQDQKTPPSLRNIMKKIPDCTTDSTLEKWAKQGVLMLNSSLTVRHKSPASHMKMWKDFTSQIIKTINDECNSIVFVAWGAFAYNKYMECSVNNDKHSLIVCSHPSPLSCSRKLKQFPAFKEINTFMIINMKLKEQRAIIW